MRIIGYACKHPEPPLRRAFVPLGQLTVLLGPNDSGKSSLLGSVSRDLVGGHFAHVDSEKAAEIGGAFFAELTREELDRLIRRAADGRERTRSEYGSRWRGQRPPWDEGLWSLRREAAAGINDLARDDDAIAAAIELLRNEAKEADQVGRVLAAALHESGLVAFECAGIDSSGERVWNVYWCLGAAPSLAPRVQEALAASEIRPFRDRRRAAVKGPQPRRGLYEAVHGRPLHLQIETAPVAIASLGPVTGAMPTGVAAPAEADIIRTEVARTLTQIVSAARYALSDVAHDGYELSAEEQRERAAPRGWLERDRDGGVRINAEALGAANLIARLGNERLPDFVARHYQLRVVILPTERWLDEPPLDIRLRVRATGSLIEEFPIEDVADGYRLWVQLALLQALEEAALLENVTWRYASDAADAIREAQEAEGLRSADADELIASAEHLEGQYQALIAKLRASAQAPDTVGADALNGLEQELKPRPASAEPGIERSWFLVVDEPERHLHGNLQRAAARWLSEAAQTGGASSLFATHSAAFLSLPAESVLYVRVERADRAASFQPFTPGQLDELASVAQAMGYDRGELLSTVSVWLIVEGPADRLVLERLAGPELHQSGIAVLPLHGTANWKGILEADALWRYTHVPVAVMFDNVPPERVEQMTAVSNEELEALAKSNSEANELKDMARLLRAAREYGRRIHAVPNPAPDMLSHLDEGVLRELYPDFPGHAEAEVRWRRHGKGGRDNFFRDRFGIAKTPEAFERIVELMLVRGCKPTALLETIRFCSQLAL
jgi:hypothetical protein